MKAHILIIAWMISFSVFSHVECEERRMIDPRNFSNEEFVTRREWHHAYFSYKENSGKTPKKFSRVISKATKGARPLLRNAVVQAYESGVICREERWMTPLRFFEIVARCGALEAALQKHDGLEATFAEYDAAYKQYLQEHDHHEAEAVINAPAEAYDEFLATQAARQKDGIAPFTMFSIKHFADEARFIDEQFARKREDLRHEMRQGDSLQRIFSARKKQIVTLHNALRKFLKDVDLLIDGRDEHDVELIYSLDNFSGDISVVLNLNRLLREIQTTRVQAAHDLGSFTQMIAAAMEHFCAHNAESHIHERLNYYAAALDAMILTMRKLWRERIQEGYNESLDELLNTTDPHLQFYYVLDKQKSDHDADDVEECLFCADERALLPACANDAHRICAPCLKSHVVAKLAEGDALSCPYANCENHVQLDYAKLLESGIFPYELFEAYRNRWVLKSGLFARCAMGCYFFHEIPKDKIPGQASPPCPDCQSLTCLSCKNLAHAGSKECRAPDAESMRQAHEVMFKAGYRACPACGAWALKESGCDFVTCVCGQRFSYSSGEAWQHKHVMQFGYHHLEVQDPVRVNNDL